MAATPDGFAFDIETALDAAKRWEHRKPRRELNEKLAAEGRWTEVENKERLVKVANRRIRQLKQAAQSVNGLPQPVMDLVQKTDIRAEDINNDFMERVIGATRDFLGINFFEAGLTASRAVARVVSRISSGRRSFGSGFMVTPRLFITNHHVLPSADVARASIAEFNFQLDAKLENAPVSRFTLRPDLFFFNDKPNDMALVGIDAQTAGGISLSQFGYCPLIGAEGKIANTEWVNIVQHPKGDLKQVVIRENRLIDLPDKQEQGEFDTYAYYEADTEPGSSGSPVFNDMWEVIALHHSSVPRRNQNGKILDRKGRVWPSDGDPTLIDWVGNEGIRTSRIVNKLATVAMSGEQKKLLDEFMQIARGDVVVSQTVVQPTPIVPARKPQESDTDMAPQQDRSGSLAPVSIHIPITINLTVGPDGVRQAKVAVNPDTGKTEIARVSQPASTDSAAPTDAQEAAGTAKKKADPEAMKIEKPYTNRKGFDANFLGFPAPLPKLTAKIKPAAVKIGAGTELKYHHYSVIFNGKRKTAFVSAVNINLQAPFKVTGERRDKWFFDDRFDEKLQAGNDAYANEVTDRGHLTRRADSAWGETQHEANKANADTFHWTNCAIQHETFNRATLSEAQNEFLWGSIEEHIAKQATAIKKKLSVFNGPIMRTNDQIHRGILVPKEFFKIVVCKSDAGKPQAFAFKLSQSKLIAGLSEEAFVELDFEPGQKFEAFQVKIAEIEKLTGLDFTAIRKFDVLTTTTDEAFTESETQSVALTSLDSIILSG